MSIITPLMTKLLEDQSSDSIKFKQRSNASLSHLKLNYHPFITIVCLQKDDTLTLHPDGLVTNPAIRLKPEDPKLKEKLKIFLNKVLKRYKPRGPSL